LGNKKRKPTVLQFFAINIFVVSVLFICVFYFIWVKYEHRRFNKAVAESKRIYIESKKQALKTIVEQFYQHLLLNIKYERSILERQISMVAFFSLNTKKIRDLQKICRFVKNENPVINYAFFKGNKRIFSSLPIDSDFFKQKDNFEILKTVSLFGNREKFYLFVLKKDFQELIKNHLLGLFKDISFNYSGYLFIVDSKGIILLSAHKLMNVKISDMSERFGEETEKLILEKARNNRGGFVEYTWYKPDLKTVSRKISYIKFNPQLKWIIGAGIYLDDIEQSFLPIYTGSKHMFYSNILKVGFLIFVILILDLGLLFMLIGDRIQFDFSKINKLFDNFDQYSSSEIESFNSGDLNFSETISFAEKVKKSLLEIKNKNVELRKTNMLLEESNEKFVKLAKYINNGVVVLDRIFRIEFANKKFCEIFGCFPDFIEGANFLQFFPDEEKRTISSMIEKFLIMDVETVEPQIKKITVNKTEKIIELSFTRLRLEDGDKIICTIADITDKQKILERLKFLTSQFEKAEDMAKVGNWIYYPEKKKFWASKEAFKIYDVDLTDDGMIDLSVVNSRVVEEDMSVAFRITMEPIKNKRVYEGSFRVRDRVGRIKNIISKGEPVLDENGSVIRVEGVLKDVTDLKEVEEKLQKQIELLERTQTIAQVGYWEYKFDTDEFLIKSSFFSKAMGKNVLPKEELLFYIVEEDKEKIRKIIETEFDDFKPIAGTYRVILPEKNALRYLYFESDKKFNDNGKWKRSGWLQDITKLKRLEEEIEIEKSKLLNTINALSEGVALLDGNFNIVFTNESFRQIFRVKTLKEKNIVTFLKGLNVEGFDESLDLENFPYVVGENKKYRIAFKDAEIILNFELRKLQKTTDFSGYVFVVEDITHKEKFTEEIVKSQNIRLLNKVAASLAHDLNNLLGSILGRVSILEKEAKDTKIARDMAKIIRNINIARALATQFLTFSKSGKPLIRNIEKSTLKQIIDDLADFVFSGTSINVRVDIEDKLFAIKGDKTQIAQIILNLFSNARDVLKNRGKIDVKVLSVEGVKPTSHCKKGDYVLIKISDNGPGIPEDKLKSIFEFFVGYKKEGFGLGLAIVKNIIDSHGGCLDVESKVGEGTSFFIYLPAVKVFEKSEQESVDRVSLTDEKDVDLSFLKVAVLEDEVPMQETIYDLMDFLGVNCDIFSKGEDLVQAIKNSVKRGTKYDIAILDLTVKGGLGGKDVIDEIKEIDSEIIAVVSSGYSRDPIVSKFHEFGFDGALPKPYSLDELESLLKNFAKKIRDA